MSDLENKKAEEAPKKRPYNLREKKEKKAAYRSLIRPELADELYDKILNIVVVQKKYKDPDYSAKDLAKELKTNMVGFANRQSFYAAFYKNVGETPNGYRKKHAESKK